MNPEVPSMKREDLEAKVTALLLGELPAEEAALLRELIARDAGLARWHDRLKLTLGLLRETIAMPEVAPAAPPKLSPERREKLLAHFKTVAPKEFAKSPERKTSWLFVIAAVASVVILASLTLPTLSGGKSKWQGLLGGRAEKSTFLGLRWFQHSKEEGKPGTLVESLPAEASAAPAKSAVVANSAASASMDVAAQKPSLAPPPAATPSPSQIVLPAPVAEAATAESERNAIVSGLTAQSSATGATSYDYMVSRNYQEITKGNQPSSAPTSSPVPAPATPPASAESGTAAATPLNGEPELRTKLRREPQSLLGGDRIVTQDSNRKIDELKLAEAVQAAKGIVEAHSKADQQIAAGNSVASTIVLPAPSAAPQVPYITGTYAYQVPGSDSAPQLDELAKREQTDAALSQRALQSSQSGRYARLNNRFYDSNPPVLANRFTGTARTFSLPTQAEQGAGNAITAGVGVGVGGGVNGQSIGGTIPQVTASPVPLLGDIPALGGLLADKESKSAATASAIDRPGNGQVGSTNFYVDKDTGQVVVMADARSKFQNNLISNPNVTNGGILGLDDAKKDRGLEADKAPLTASKKPGVADRTDAPLAQPALPPPVPQPEVLTSTNIFSTFSLNVSDASFKLAAASLQNGVMPDAASIRSEEFINAFDYRDPEPAPGAPIGFAWERAGYPFAHNRDLLRFSVKTAAQGRQEGRPLNLVLLLDKSGSMERADRVEIIEQALRVLASQLHAQDTLSVVVFARTARLWADGVPGSQAGEVAQGLNRLTPEGGTDLEEAMKLAYATAVRHYTDKGDNRVVLLTDGAANLGEVNPETLQQKVEANRKQGIALDCFGVGWDGYNDNLMETLSRAGHGRYGFINTPEEAATEFAGKLAGALRVAASDVKVQVEFNPNRVTAYRQMGYARHQLTAEQFRDNTVAAAQIGAAESGNALYTVEVNPAGDGPLCTVRVRFRLPGTSDYQEHAWDVPYTGTAVTLDQASPAMRLAATAAAFSEWLASNPYAGEVTPDQLLAYVRGVPEIYGADAVPKKLEWMIRQAKSISGK
jgi:Mg-chelatase subunit ChlD